MANSKYIIGNKVYEEAGERKITVGGRVLEEATVTGGGGPTVIPKPMQDLGVQFTEMKHINLNGGLD